MSKLLSKISEKELKLLNDQLKIINIINNKHTYKDKIDFLSSRFKKIGEGSSRIVFQIYNKGVIKLAKNKAGIDQNLQEIHCFTNSDITTKILIADPSNLWIIQRYTPSITEQEFERITKYSFKSFGEAVMYKINNELSSDWPKPSNYDFINKDQLFNKTISLIIKNDLQGGDVIRISSWGQLNNQPVLIDTGLSRDIFDTYYK